MSETRADDEGGALRRFLADRDVPCPVCGYNMRGVQGRACPECGMGVDLALRQSPRRALWLWAMVVGAGLGALFQVPHLAIWLYYYASSGNWVMWPRYALGPGLMLLADAALLALAFRARRRGWGEAAVLRLILAWGAVWLVYLLLHVAGLLDDYGLL